MFSRKRVGSVLSALVASAGFSFGQATQYYVVASGGNDGNVGTSWATAFKTLQHAIDTASATDSIVVAEGGYGPAQFGGSYITLDSDIDIHGGFAGGGSIDKDNPDGSFLQTVINGALMADSAPVVTSIDDDAAVLDGFVIQAGDWSGNGGGFYCENPTDVRIENTTFRYNAAQSPRSQPRAAGSTSATWAICWRRTASSTTTSPRREEGSTSREGAPSTRTSPTTAPRSSWPRRTRNRQPAEVIGYVWHCTISKNTSDTGAGAGIHVGPSATGTGSWLALANSIVYHNRFGFDLYRTPPTGGTGFRLVAVYTCYGTQSGAHFGSGNITSDPKFVDAAGGNFRLKTTPTVSPCIDAGLDSLWMRDFADVDEDGNDGELLPVDFDFAGRVFDFDGLGEPNIDMGAFENHDDE